MVQYNVACAVHITIGGFIGRVKLRHCVQLEQEVSNIRCEGPPMSWCVRTV